ncbi:mitochondrial glycoprotein [Gloeopeniophorella convolvens]|nr:mitochondrial glycoprotein [Gloeopeniophorella convolvens]
MSALRAVRQLASSSARALSQRTSLVSARAVARLPVFARVDVAGARAPFSVSARRLGEGTTDGAVSSKIGEELAYEKEAAVEGEPSFIKEFKSSGIWTVEDLAGSDEITIHRKFGNEHIRLIFSIADLQTAEDSFETPEGEEGASEEDVEVSYPLRCSFTITKPSVPGALSIDAVCQEGTFVVENVSFYNDSKIATDLTAEADWRRRGLYIGPQFETLDVSLQEEFEKFLQERGINESLAFFVPEYAQYKEQKEYVDWLGNVKKFIDA